MKYVITTWLVALSFVIFGQGTEFRTGDKEFIEDVENYIKPYDKSLAKKISGELENTYIRIFNGGQKAKIVGYANQLIKKKIRLKPDFIAFFNSISGFAKTKNFSKQEFEDWSNLMDALMKSKNKKRLTDFLKFSDNLFNRGFLSSSSSVTWRLDKGTYSFSYKNGAFVSFDNVTLVCTSKNDSSVIYNTNGLLNVSTNVFVGKKGTVTWERVKLPKDKTYAELAGYKINLRSAGYDADSVLMHSTYFANPVIGKLRDKVLTFNSVERARYPSFSSYDQSVEIKNIFPNIDYKGGFSLVGINFRGGASGNNLASIIINRKGKKFIVVDTKKVDMNPKKINARNSRATIYLTKDETISQFSCDFNYLVQARETNLQRVENKSMDYPFESTYHKLNMRVDKMTWREGEDTITMGAYESSGMSRASFESILYYNPKDYGNFMAGKGNLVKSLYRFYQEKDNAVELSAMEFSNYVKSLYDNVSPYLIKMSNLGLISFDLQNKKILVKPKLETYINSRTLAGDYDDLYIRSSPKSPINATIDLSTLELTVNGIRSFELSKKRFVRVYPKRGSVIVGKNRNIKFSGVINAGRTEYFGSDLNFDYQKFAIQFEKMDTMRIRVFPMDAETDQKQVRLISKLYDLKGQLTIDGEDNKAGKKPDFGHFPILSVTNSPKIYYNQVEILKGIYSKENFYYEVEPFEMDSLLTFSNGGIHFSGTLYSADIFPPLTKEIGLMKDYTLGFAIKDIKENIYKSSGQYNDDLELNAQGLIGNGKLSFMTSSAYSKKITFFPDSMVAKTGLYTNKSQTLPSVPEIKAENCFIIFQPHKGIWKASNIDSSMYVFNDKVSKFDGYVVLTKKKMTGSGKFSSNRIAVSSKDFIFGQNELDALTSDFTLNGVGENDPPSLEATNMKMELDFVKREGNFKSNTGTSIIEFPINNFTATTDEFDWTMDKNIMDFKKVIDTANFQNFDENKNLKPNFVSTLKEHEGLGFFSGNSRYYIDSNILLCKKIPYIVVADSRIIPYKGEMKIKKKAELVALTSSTIVSNFTSKYHQFKNAEIEIISSKEYIGNGFYTVSSDKTINSKVFFSNIEVTPEGVTLAEGNIHVDSNFYLSPQFKYYGDITVRGNEFGVSYDGQTKIITNCEELALDWIQFKAIVDTSKIIIPLGEAFTGKVSGPIIGREDGVSFYTSFLTDKSENSDIAITPSDGFLSYNNEKGLFEIGAKEKLLNNKASGNYISFDNENCSFKSIGNLQLAKDMDQFKVKLVGEMEYNKLKDTVLDMNATMRLVFPFSKAALVQMKTEITNTQVQQLIDLSKSNFDLYINNELPKETATKVNNELSASGRITKMPKELESTLTLFDLNFYWDDDNQSFMAQGYANVASVGEEQLFRRCKVYVQIQKRRSGDLIALMIEYKPQGFYYFSYKNGELSTYSTDTKYNEIIELTPAKETKVKGKKDEEDFYYGLATKSKPLLFLRNFEEEEGFDED